LMPLRFRSASASSIEWASGLLIRCTPAISAGTASFDSSIYSRVSRSILGSRETCALGRILPRSRTNVRTIGRILPKADLCHEKDDHMRFKPQQRSPSCNACEPRDASIPCPGGRDPQ
jgi:hypothetical protein